MVVGDERTKSVHAMTLYGRRETWPCPCTPRVLPAALQASWPGLLRRVQIKNIKLHIVTDIKVNFNSMLGFRISNLVGGKGTLTNQLKIFSHLPWTSAALPVPCHRVTHHAARYPALQKTAASSALVQDQKAYGTRCSQAVPHPSTILARRCLTSVIRRERVCSSWYGRRQRGLEFSYTDFAFTSHNIASPILRVSRHRSFRGYR